MSDRQRRGSIAGLVRTARQRLRIDVVPAGVTPGAIPRIDGVDTSTAAFLGVPAPGAPSEPVEVTSFAGYVQAFGTAASELARGVRLFFENGGRRAWVLRTPDGLSDGLDALEDVRFAVLAIPDATGLDPDEASELVGQAVDLCEERGAFLLVDAPPALAPADVPQWVADLGSIRSAALYMPRLRLADGTATAASGAVAGVYARTDLERGVWRAPAGGVVQGAVDATVALGDAAVDDANAAGINVIRKFPTRGLRVWGARTLSSDPEWKYVNIRRLTIFIEHSIDEGTQWAVFEPNGEQLWRIVRAAVEAFMLRLFQQGAFEATRAEDAYFVRCDRTTMTQDDIDNGRLVIVVGFAPLRPAEFVIVRVG
jgi:phage tail sheath protein FI